MTVCVHVDREVQSYSTLRKSKTLWQPTHAVGPQELLSHLLIREHIWEMSPP